MHNQPKQQPGTKPETGCVMVWLEKRRFLIVKRRFLKCKTPFSDVKNAVF